MVELYTLFQAGKYEEARDLHMRLQRLNTYFEYDPGYVAPCKEALRLLGLPAGSVRAPLPELSDSELTLIREALEQLGLL
jgi:dihydrodipicolinate synthase/N-acetylneuraminate lyase